MTFIHEQNSISKDTTMGPVIRKKIKNIICTMVKYGETLISWIKYKINNKQTLTSWVNNKNTKNVMPANFLINLLKENCTS